MGKPDTYWRIKSCGIKIDIPKNKTIKIQVDVKKRQATKGEDSTGCDLKEPLSVM